jgi:hypothetical protein
MSTPIPTTAAEHLNYQTGMFLTSDYMTLEQNYFSNWFRLQNRYLYTPGVLSGMAVSQQNNALCVTQGVAFDANGNFLILPDIGGNPVSVPTQASNPFYVWAIYPDTTKQSTPVVNAAAQLQAGNSVAATGVLLATVALDANGQITAVTDARVPVTSLLPAILTAQNNALRLPSALQGKVSVATTTLLAAGNSISQTVPYSTPTQTFTNPPSVLATVAGSLPFALAVAADLNQFTLTLTALQATPAGVTSVDVNWLVLPN